MKIFICWSGRRSKELAEALHQWLPTVLKGLTPTYSPNISKGELWFDSISRDLYNSRAGIICLTPENMESAWMHFEAGALFRETTKIFTLLYKVHAGTLLGPLSHFQATEATKVDDLQKLVEALAILMAEKAPAPHERLETLAEQWPVFKKHLDDITDLTVTDLVPNLGDLFHLKKTYHEPLAECENQDWLARYMRARETLLELERSMEKVRNCAAPHVADYYSELIQEVKGYAMAMEKLLKPKRFVSEDGTLKINDAIQLPCEQRRRRILVLLNALIEGIPPILDESRLFRKLVTIEEKKTLCIFPFEERIKRGVIPKEIVIRGRVSPWEFDRIVYYLVQENRNDLDIQHLSECVTTELEIVRAREQEGSLIALHYAIRAIERAVLGLRPDSDLSPGIKSHVQRVADRVEKFLREDPRRDTGDHIKENLAALAATLKL